MHGLLWTAVRRGEVKVSRSTERALATEFLRTKARHIKFWETYEEISYRLGEEEIEFTAIKGVTAEARWYDEMGERPCRDVDLWIAPDDLNRFEEVVRILQPDHPLRDTVQGFVNRGYLFGLDIRLESGVSVDLHADLFKLGLRSRTAGTMWGRTEEFTSSRGSTTRVLDSETALIQFLLHLNVDRFSRLGRITDILRVWNQEPLNWSYISQIVTGEGLEVPVYMSLFAALDPLDVLVPIERPSGLRAWLWNRIWPVESQALGDAAEQWRLRQRWISLLARGRLLESLTWISGRTFPPPQVLSYFYPDTRGPYLWRVLASRARFQRDWRRRWSKDGAARD